MKWSLNPPDNRQREHARHLRINPHHSIISIDPDTWLLNHDAPPPALQQLPPHFRTNALVTPRKQQIQQRLPLILSDVVPVPLRKRQQTLMPNHRQLACVTQVASYGFRIHGISAAGTYTAKAQEVEDEGVDDFVRERVFLFEERFDEDVAGACGIGVR